MIPDQLAEPAQPPHVLGRIRFGKLDKQDRFRIASHDRVDGRLEHRDVAGQAQHSAIDELDRDGSKLDDMLRHVHRLMEAAEMAGADGACAKQRRKLELDAGREGKRALRPDKNVRQIEVVATGHEGVEIIAADPALHFGEPRLDLIRLGCGKIEHALRQRTQRRRGRHI